MNDGMSTHVNTCQHKFTSLLTPSFLTQIEKRSHKYNIEFQVSSLRDRALHGFPWHPEATPLPRECQQWPGTGPRDGGSARTIQTGGKWRCLCYRIMVKHGNTIYDLYIIYGLYVKPWNNMELMIN